jgi:alpha-mannosidase
MLPWQRSQVIEGPIDLDIPTLQRTFDGRPLLMVTAEPLAARPLQPMEIPIESHVKIVENADGSLALINAKVEIVIGKDGNFKVLRELGPNGRNLVAENAPFNQFVIFDDVPLYWDNWDVDIFHLESRKELGLRSMKVLEKGPLRVVVEMEVPISDKSTLKERVILHTHSNAVELQCDVDW